MAENTNKQAKTAKKAAVQLPSKKTMNFVHHESSINVKKMLPLILVIIVAMGVFAKFAILDPLDKKTAAYTELGLKQQQLDAVNAKLSGYDELGRPMELPLYNMEAGDDLYDVFLNGSQQSLVVLENPNARTDKHLVIFRDSYACSIAPLFLEDYAKVTLVDLRASQSIPMMVNYRDADVLFLQSTLVLNNPDSYRIWGQQEE